MKKILLLILFVPFLGQSQQKQEIDLVWKVNDTITYSTVMKDVSEKEKSEKKDKETDSIKIRAKAFFKKFQEQNQNLKYQTKLYPDKNDDIDIAMYLIKEENDSTSLISGMAELNGNIVLRGKINKEGEITGFYYKTDQNNLISILFELPNHPVSVRDSWSLSTNFINMDQNFVADSTARHNEVRLDKIINRNGEKIAVLKYDILEYVSGVFGNKLMDRFLKSNDDNKVHMKMTHQATAEFSLDQGRWLTYEGEMAIDSNMGFTGVTQKKTKFKLVPLP